MSHDEHGWLSSAFDEENSNRYQPRAPLVIWCTICETLLPADDEWVNTASRPGTEARTILTEKIHRFDGVNVRITSVGHDFRDRLMIQWEIIPPILPKKRRWWQRNTP